MKPTYNVNPATPYIISSSFQLSLTLLKVHLLPTPFCLLCHVKTNLTAFYPLDCFSPKMAVPIQAKTYRKYQKRWGHFLGYRPHITPRKSIILQIRLKLDIKNLKRMACRIICATRTLAFIHR